MSVRSVVFWTLFSTFAFIIVVLPLCTGEIDADPGQIGVRGVHGRGFTGTETVVVLAVIGLLVFLLFVLPALLNRK